jgi:hypothetical protein
LPARADANEDPALAARGDHQVAFEKEREPTEHLLLVDGTLGRDQFTDAVGEVLVVGHDAMLRRGAYPELRRGRA